MSRSGPCGAPAVPRFVDALSRCDVPPNAHNQYAGRSVGAAIRRENLSRYLGQMLEKRPSTLLVGEAPSHRGCRLTGIPFMSEAIMLRGVDEAALFGAERGYRKATPGDRPSTEASATIVWETIATFEPTPLLWNAFPFHPHQASLAASNRAPNAAELEIGKGFLLGLLELFEIGEIVAVGNRARDSLASLGIDHVRVRHPARGGKREFTSGIARLCKNS